MQAVVRCKQGEANFEFDGTEGEFYYKLGDFSRFIPAPDTITVLVGTRQIIINRAQNQFGAAFNQVSYSDLEGLKPSELPWKMLKKIDENRNIYSEYEMIPHNLGGRTASFTISKGRSGAAATDINRVKLSNYQNDPILFWINYYDKLAEGYVDYSEYTSQNLPKAPTIGVKKKNTAPCTKQNVTPAMELFQILSKAAQEYATEQLDPDVLEQVAPFTELQIQKAREIWSTLGKAKNVDQFNSKIKKILALAPRRIDAYHGQTVQSYLAKEVSDPKEQQKIYSEIIDREDGLINSMEAILASRKVEQQDSVLNESNPFKNVNIAAATQDEIDTLKNTMFNADHASGVLKNHIKRVWHVDAEKQNPVFEQYCKEHGNPQTKLLFHGSRTQNWISIIENSLLLNPNAVINGKAFGYGIYFALSADKSFGYTSASWGARYNSDTLSSGFMGVYETAYGNAADSSIVHDYSQRWMDENGYNCLHYHAGGNDGQYSFIRDEIVFYSEGAMRLKYIIEFTNDNDAEE